MSKESDGHLQRFAAWFSEAVIESLSNTPRSSLPGETSALADEYWRGYRAAATEISELLLEDRLIEQAIHQLPQEKPWAS